MLDGRRAGFEGGGILEVRGLLAAAPVRGARVLDGGGEVRLLRLEGQPEGEEEEKTGRLLARRLGV